jgi:hypothetical protein
VTAKVFAHMMLEAVDQGLLKPAAALKALAERVALPDNAKADPHGACVDLWRQIHRGGRLRRPGESNLSDGDVDAALDGLEDKRGTPYMRRVREKVTQQDVDRVLDAARDSRGRPLFPRDREEDER